MAVSTSVLDASANYMKTNGKDITVWISGGKLNENAKVTCRITTSAGRVYDNSMILSIVNW